jgi:hypothetical protein
MPSCFISHSTQDRLFVENELTGLLKAVGIDAWYSRESITTSEQWERSILAGLESSDLFLLVMSRSSAKSDWVKDELAWAMTYRGDRIIPVSIEPCEPTAFHIRLPRLQVLDFTQDQIRARQRLVEVLVNFVYKAAARRAAAITGEWAADIHQVRGPDGTPIDYRAKFVLIVSGPTISGEMIVCNPIQNDVPELNFRFSAGFFHDRFLQLSYVAVDPERIQFGAAILQLDDSGRTMEGMFVGYGALSRAIINGTMKLRKT